MNLKERVRKGEVTIGSWLQLPSPRVAKIMGIQGFDWLAIDIEHGSISIETLPEMIEAISAGGATPLVRLSHNDPVEIKRVLDAGAQGIIVPMVNSANEAEAAVKSAKYPPDGIRGIGYSNANLYGAKFKTYFERFNSEVVIIVQIEHIDSVQKVDEILAVEGIDGYMIGPYDLSGSMGLTGQLQQPDFLAALEKPLTAAGKTGKAPGIHVVPPDAQQVTEAIGKGYKFIAYSIDAVMLMSACRNGLQEIRERITQKKDGNT